MQAVFAGVDAATGRIDSEPRRRSEANLLREANAAKTPRSAARQHREATVAGTGELDDRRPQAASSSRRAAETAAGSRSESDERLSQRRSSPTPDVTKWVQVDLGQALPIDEIRLIPARPTDFRDTPGFGFPARFRVEVSDDPTFARPDRSPITRSGPNPDPDDGRIVIAPAGRPARYVRVTATRLWQRRNDYVFALAELQVDLRRQERGAGGDGDGARFDRGGPWSTKIWSTASTAGTRLPDCQTRSRPPLTDDLLCQAPSSSRRRQRLRRCADRARAASRALTRTCRAGRARQAAVTADAGAIRSTPSCRIAPRPIHVLNAATSSSPASSCRPGACRALPGSIAKFQLADPDDEGSRRAALADGSPSPTNPLTWRSIVNRVWQYHFGRGLVDTPNDFGRNGSRPTHPELLDWLAVEFRDSGESLKTLHRLIVTSAVYRQSSRDDAGHREDRRRQSLALADESHPARCRGDPRHRAGGQRQAGSDNGRPGFELFRFKDDHRRSTITPTPATIDNPGNLPPHRLSVHGAQRAEPVPGKPATAPTRTSTRRCATHADGAAGAGLLNDPFMVQAVGVFRRPARRSSDTSPRTGRDGLSPAHSAGRRQRRSATRWRPMPGSTGWRTRAGCCSTRTSSCSSTDCGNSAKTSLSACSRSIEPWSKRLARRSTDSATRFDRRAISLAVWRRSGRHCAGHLLGRRRRCWPTYAETVPRPELNGGAASPGQGEARRPALHVGSGQPVRHVRLQAGA